MADVHDDLVAVLRGHANGGERPSRPASAQAADALDAYRKVAWLLRRTVALSLIDGTTVACTCTWSYAREPVRTSIPADCPIHAGEPRVVRSGVTDPIHTGRNIDPNRSRVPAWEVLLPHGTPITVIAGPTEPADDPPSDLAETHALYVRAKRAPGGPSAGKAIASIPWLVEEVERLRALVVGQPAPDTDPEPTHDDWFVAIDTGLNAAGVDWSEKRRRFVIDTILGALGPLIRLAESTVKVDHIPVLLPGERLERRAYNQWRETGDADAAAALDEFTAGGPATPGPTREQVEEAIVSSGGWLSAAATNRAANAVLALFGRSAPEPPETQP